MATHSTPKSRFTAAIMIASDRSSQGVRADTTGPGLKRYLENLGYGVSLVEIVPDDKPGGNPGAISHGFEEAIENGTAKEAISEACKATLGRFKAEVLEDVLDEPFWEEDE